MKILFEGEKYDNALLEGRLDSRYFSPNGNNIDSTITSVGYYYNSKGKDSGAVLILPKVFVYNKGFAFGKYRALDIFEYNDDTKKMLKEDGFDKILFELSIWMYQAIATFKKRHPTSKIEDKEAINNIVSNLGDSDNTELDIVLSLLRFHKENQQLFTYVSKLNHCGKKIDWKKTVTKKQPFLSNNQPVYVDVIARKNTLNFDEELIIIFYSTLYYISKKYNYNVVFNQNYDLIKGAAFERLINRGTKRLKEIKYKYFSDKLMSLWKLLFSYFERLESTKKSEKKKEEVILVKNFNIVFEDMIDDLIGDDSLFKELKSQKDGKRVDHIYRGKSLILEDNIYFVGDSKYYKPDNSIGKESVAKQFTYAKNIIQYNIDILTKQSKRQGDNTIIYRDDITEGYNITPNFFISAFVEAPFDFHSDGLKEDGKAVLQYHYPDRLFDRDTLLIQKYNINFLFALSAYISKGSLGKEIFKNKAQVQFRAKMIEYFRTNYTFQEATPKNDLSVKEFADKYFRQLNGRMYRPSKMEDSLIIATSVTDKSLIDFGDDCDLIDYKIS